MPTVCGSWFICGLVDKMAVRGGNECAEELAGGWRGNDERGRQGRMVGMSIGEELLAEHRRRRRAGDPRLTESDREFLGRLVDGDLAEEFQVALDAVSEADPLLGGGDSHD
jgi:hypothetical protein